ncbi:MAG TPA: M24B family metallopeptidase, partial [Rhizobiaceae bacterium]|nr:M24B family metallopeptidase [Rhizobiaceae bacterium]
VADRLREIVEGNGGKTVLRPDPARLPRALKNETELDGARAAHRRDGVAMCRFLAWLEAQKPGTVDEIAAATKLEEIRVTTGEEFQMPLKEISFETISASGPNAALPHYRVSTESNRTLQAGEVYLVDSGGQYEDGTTDITRTVAIGDVPEAVRRQFTLVLKGMISICTARFPAGTRGIDLDPFARRALWQAGHDFQHGTGHGVGSYLSVHEGPQSISRRGMHELKPGMILSDEPGFYQEGSHGIRVENLIVVTEPMPIEGGTQPMLGFETLTLCPIDPRMIVSDLLSPDERAWLDAFHARVRAELAPLVGDEVRAWLEGVTGE